MELSVEYNGKEVKHPTARKVVVSLVTLGAIAIFLLATIMSPIILLLIPASILPHFILRRCGRRGFFEARNGHLRWTFTGALARR